MLLRQAHLDEAKFFKVAVEAVRLGVERHAVMRGEALQKLIEGSGGGDQSR